jgi:hypothetical protein
MLSGELRAMRLSVAPDGRQVRSALCLVDEGEERQQPLDEHFGETVRLEFSGAISCVHCARNTRRSFNSGYCYPCFTTLARCDLCVMSPDRCHYYEGTCREPQWGESFCMESHTVYLANTSGLKVGITRGGREQGRWLDQGAVQALPILSAKTRREAGLAEVTIAKEVADKTDWQRMLRGEPPHLDLLEERDRIRERGLILPAGVSWLDAPVAHQFHYPVDVYPAKPSQLRVKPGVVLSGNLEGVKGQYLLLSSGVFNVRRFAGYHVRISFSAASPGATKDQMNLF